MHAVPKPVQGDRILYRHGRSELPYATPDVVPGVIYEVLGEDAVADASDARGGERRTGLVVSVLAHDALGQPILVRGRVGEPAHRLPRAAYRSGAPEVGSWCYVPEREV